MIPGWLFDELADSLTEDRALVGILEAWDALLVGAEELPEDPAPWCAWWLSERHVGAWRPHPDTGRLTCPVCHPAAPPEPPRLAPVVQGPLALGLFRDGPLADRRHRVPAHGPATIRWHGEPGAIHFYVWKRASKRTYLYSGRVNA